jgi:hypothetical protein
LAVLRLSIGKCLSSLLAQLAFTPVLLGIGQFVVGVVST